MNTRAPGPGPDALDPVPAAPVLAAFSGGLDSTVLLHWLAARGDVRARGLRAVHVHHGLHPAADDWAAHCERTCAALGIPLQVRRVRVEPRGEGLEAAARAARHAAFAGVMRPGEAIALAHHRDDQAETVLLRLLRGAGDGLAAMRPLRAFHAGWLWRPLLGLPRALLHDWARTQGLAWVEDPSNAATAHDRNFLRHAVLPRLRERWPDPAAALAHAAARLAEQQDLLAGEDARRLARAQGLAPRTLSLPALLAEAPDWRDRVLRAWLVALGLPALPARALATLADEVLSGRPDARAEFAMEGVVLRRWRDLLFAGPFPPPLPADWSVAWDGREALPLPGGGRLRLLGAPAFEAPLRARARQGGERLRLPGRTHHHALKDVLQALGLPPWERAALPVLHGPDGEPWAAGDVVLAAPLADWLAARGARLRRED